MHPGEYTDRREVERAIARGVRPSPVGSTAQRSHSLLTYARAPPSAGDVTKVQEVSRLVDRVCAVHDGRIDVLVNNVGCQKDDGHPLHTLDEAVWDQALAMNREVVCTLHTAHKLPASHTSRTAHTLLTLQVLAINLTSYFLFAKVPSEMAAQPPPLPRHISPSCVSAALLPLPCGPSPFALLCPAAHHPSPAAHHLRLDDPPPAPPAARAAEHGGTAARRHVAVI